MTPLVRPVLTQLRATVQHLSRFPASDVASQMLFGSLERALRHLLVSHGGMVHFSLVGRSLYFGDEPMPHESLEFADLGKQIASRGVESISIDPTVSKFEVIVLTQFLAGASAEPPAMGGVRVNDISVTIDRREDPFHGKELRPVYRGAMEVLREAFLAARDGNPMDMLRVRGIIDQLVTASSGRPTATALLATMRSSSEYFYHHSVNTTLLAIEMGRAAGMRMAELRVLGIGALLHDVGKGLVVPEAIDDPGRLGPEQWEKLRGYPGRSARVILEAATPGTEPAAVIALEHAVRHDLSGYPAMPPGHSQHPAAALLAVVDVYDALTSRRPYRRAETNGNALRILLEGSGTQFSPGMVRLFVERFGTVPPGSCFRMKSGEILVAAGATGNGAGVRGLIVEDAGGNVMAEPVVAVVEFPDLEGELSVIESSIRPAAYLDHLESAERRTPDSPVR